MKSRAILWSLAGAAAVVLVLVVACTLVPSNSGTGPPLSDGCGKAPPTVPGETAVLPMTVDGLEREYRLHLPADYDQNTPTSLVLAFHFYQGDAQELSWVMRDHADEHGYIAVFPQATSFASFRGPMTSWNDLSCSVSSGPEGPTCTHMEWPSPPECGESSDCAWCTCYDDLAFVDQLLDELEDTLCMDLDRVYATGMSNGATFVHRLGCDRPERFAAIAPVSGTLAKGFNCAPNSANSISIMHLHGDQDTLFPADGSEGTAGHLLVPVDAVVDAWAGAESQDCDDSETPYPTPKDGTMGLECTQRANCATGAEVVSCYWTGDHDMYYPLGFFGYDVVWEFFGKNSKHR